MSKVIGDFRGVNDLAAYAKAYPRFLDGPSTPVLLPRRETWDTFRAMDEKDSPTLFVRLALCAALYGFALVTTYNVVAKITLWLGLAPK